MKKIEILQRGDCVSIIAPARKISEVEVSCFAGILKKCGLKVRYSEHLFGENFQYSGKDEERCMDFQKAIDNPEIKAIFCARGGYGGMRIVDKLDFSALSQKGKWICGYSDTTVFHSCLNAMGLESLHCTMPVNIVPENADSASVKTMIKALFEGSVDYKISPHIFNRCGRAEGEICGGNLSILYALQASDLDLQTDGKILFIEDLDEYLYHIDRMMLSLKRSGKLSGLKALIVGNLSDMHDNSVPFGKTAEEIVLEHVSDYNYPVCFGFPSGHANASENNALIFGRRSVLEVKNKIVTLKTF